MRPPLPIALLPVLVLGACGPSFDPPELLTEPRLLAVVAEPPELASGDKTTLTALHHPLSGAATYEWAYCTRTSGSAAAVSPDCITNDTASYLLPIGTGETVDFTMPAFPPNQFGLPDATFGVYLPIRVRMKAELKTGNTTEIKTETGIYRLRYNVPIPMVPLPKNQNPRLTGIYVVPDDGSAPPTGPTQTALDEKTPYSWNGARPLKLRTVLADGSLEMYPILQGDLKNPAVKVVTETIDFQWYADAGTLTPATTGPERPDTELQFAKEKTPPPAGTEINVYIIARDERGGTAWLHRVVAYRP